MAENTQIQKTYYSNSITDITIPSEPSESGVSPEQEISMFLDPKLIVLNNRGVLDLSKQQTLELLKRTVNRMEFFYDSPAAREFIKTIGARLYEERASLPLNYVNVYDELLFRAKFVCLDLLEEGDIAELLESHLIQYLELPYEHVDIIKQLRKSFTRFILPPDTEPFVNFLLNSLEKNNELLGSKDLTIDGDRATVSVKPTVSNWIKDYLGFLVGLKVGEGVVQGQVNTFGRVSYINQKASAHSFDSRQREILLKILELEDWLKYGWLKEYEEASKETVVPENLKQIIHEIFLNSEGNDEKATAESGQAEVLSQAPGKGLKFGSGDSLGASPFSKAGIGGNKPAPSVPRPQKPTVQGVSGEAKTLSASQSVNHPPSASPLKGGETRDKQAEIDRKLEELKKKVSRVK